MREEIQVIWDAIFKVCVDDGAQQDAVGQS